MRGLSAYSITDLDYSYSAWAIADRRERLSRWIEERFGSSKNYDYSARCYECLWQLSSLFRSTNRLIYCSACLEIENLGGGLGLFARKKPYRPDADVPDYFYLPARVEFQLDCFGPDALLAESAILEFLAPATGSKDYSRIFLEWFARMRLGGTVLESPCLPVANRLGLHARASAKLYTLAQQFDSKIYIYRVPYSGNKNMAPVLIANAKSLPGPMMVAAACGTNVGVIASGKDAAYAIEALSLLVTNRFGESE